MNQVKNSSISSLKSFITLWLGQSISQFGSSMTGFALIVWVYQTQGTVMSTALLSVFSYVPCIFVSFFAGAIIDRLHKRSILLVCDSIAAACTLCAFLLILSGNIQVWHLYIINAVSGVMNAFQMPASKVSITLIVPGEHYARASGLRSLSDSLISVLNPVIATFLMSFWGINIIFVIDLSTFVIAFLSLVLFVKIPSTPVPEVKCPWHKMLIRQSREGLNYLKHNKGLLYLMLFMAGINFIAAITFFNILPAMILSRSGNNERILGIVSAAIGLGNVAGSLAVTARPPKNRIKTIFTAAALSFLLCDTFIGTGRNVLVWVMAAFIGNIPIPILCAAESSFLHKEIPVEIQGRIFSLRGTFQFVTIPCGYLAGGFLADKFFEPLMSSSFGIQYLSKLVGGGKGSGMALMFVITAVLGVFLSLFAYGNKEIKGLEKGLSKVKPKPD